MLAVLAARWRWVLLVLILSVAVGAGLSVTMLKRFTASATVMLDARTPEQVATGAAQMLLPAGYMTTQAELISSERVARVAIRELQLADEPAWREAWRRVGNSNADYVAWLAELLNKSLSVRPSPVSNLLTIAYTDSDPVEAARITNAFVRAYIEISRELRGERARQFGGVFDSRAQDLRAEHDRAQAKLAEFQQRNGIMSGEDNKVDADAARLVELNSQLLAAQAANAEMTSRLRQAGKQADQLNEVWRSPAVQALSADITREEVRLRELTARLGGSHPQLIEQEARLAELKARLETETGRVATRVTIDNGASQSRVAHIAAELEAQRAKVLRIQSQREQLAALQREVDRTQRAYSEAQQRLTQVSYEGQNNQTNVSVLKEATVPVAPSSPSLSKNIAASMVLGLLLGLGLVVGLELLDRRMRTADDVAELKQSLLVALPISAHSRRIPADDTSRTRLMKLRVLTGLPRP